MMVLLLLIAHRKYLQLPHGLLLITWKIKIRVLKARQTLKAWNDINGFDGDYEYNHILKTIVEVELLWIYLTHRGLRRSALWSWLRGRQRVPWWLCGQDRSANGRVNDHWIIKTELLCEITLKLSWPVSSLRDQFAAVTSLRSLRCGTSSLRGQFAAGPFRCGL